MSARFLLGNVEAGGGLSKMVWWARPSTSTRECTMLAYKDNIVS